MEIDQALPPSEPEEERRRFLERCGRFAIVTPPAITMMLSVAATPTEAVASGFGGDDPGGGKGNGNGSHGGHNGGPHGGKPGGSWGGGKPKRRKFGGRLRKHGRSRVRKAKW